MAVIFLCLGWGSAAQPIIDPTALCALPSIIDEASGLEELPNGHFLSHNDGGTGRCIFEMDASCNLLRTIYLDSINNVDIEDIAVDDSGHVYIGDFGNNNTLHGRMDLMIYKIDSAVFAANDTLVPALITYSYSDQVDFAPPASNRIYDCEGMIHFNDSLYLFSKSEATATSPYTRVYSLSDIPGNHIAQLRDSLNTGGRVNAADFNALAGKLILTSNTKMWEIDVMSPPTWFGGTTTQYDMQVARKYEGVMLKSPNEVYIVDDTQGQGVGQLFYLNFLSLEVSNEVINRLSLYPNPSSSQFTIEAGEPIEKIEIYNSSGVHVKAISYPLSNSYQIDVSSLVSGHYVCHVYTSGSRATYSSFIKL